MMEGLFRDRGHFRPLARGIRLLGGTCPHLTAREELLLADLLESVDHFDFLACMENHRRAHGKGRRALDTCR
jgi:hypothetical protein